MPEAPFRSACGRSGRSATGPKVRSSGDLVDRETGEDELALRLGEHALADQVAGGDAGRALDDVVEAVGVMASFSA